ncbi:hypothetical protein PPL_04897 [Heterostelium album PN500]|uniref:IPT/TIG domain-containing protein n=1 Tax=Heterostelium pallidum (strain ATCC 26659 / Pp 5 / PN500) TaxID=670386 RepID=D3B8V4_HETP5|nr:hypothetical protein PPL_04897 [Heterostelium album PN500]EFA82472.1 hypothetical protein PPL_04897 [Heterostelium album PN500]|eukprot:XP_020434589.1 hypothetical protein PPL_04897 [Heterostelium album PN500]
MIKNILLFLIFYNIYISYAANITSITFNGNVTTISGIDIGSTTKINVLVSIEGSPATIQISDFTANGGALQFTIPSAVGVRGTIQLEPSGVQADWNPLPVVSSVSTAPISGGTITVSGSYLSSGNEADANKSTITFPHGKVIQEYQSSSLSKVAYFTLTPSVAILYSGVNIPLTLTVRGLNQTVLFSFDKPNITGESYINTGIVLNGVNLGTNASLVQLYTDQTKITISINGNVIDKIYTLTIQIQVLGYYQIHDKGYLLTNVPLTKAGKVLIQSEESDFNPYTSPSEQGVSFSLPWDATIGNTTMTLNIGAGTSIKNLTFGDIPCSNTYTQGYNQLVCTVGNGTGSNLPVLLVYNNGVTNPASDKLFFSYQAPTVQDVGINENNLTINGTNFNYPLSVVATINSTMITCTNPYVDSFSQIYCTFDRSIGTPDKIYLNITVGNQYIADDYILGASYGIKLNINFSISFAIIIILLSFI